MFATRARSRAGPIFFVVPPAQCIEVLGVRFVVVADRCAEMEWFRPNL
jgi:hypothetical protein